MEGYDIIVVEDTSEGRIVIYLEEGETVCPTCKGAGRADSCFDCGNRGYMINDRGSAPRIPHLRVSSDIRQ